MLNHKQLISLKPKPKTYKKGLGDGLFIEVKKTYKNKNGITKGGSKTFKGRVKGQDVFLGVFGSGGGQLTLKDAREKFYSIKVDVKGKRSILEIGQQ